MLNELLKTLENDFIRNEKYAVIDIDKAKSIATTTLKLLDTLPHDRMRVNSTSVCRLYVSVYINDKVYACLTVHLSEEEKNIYYTLYDGRTIITSTRDTIENIITTINSYIKKYYYY